jgi:hypothetical protein
MATPRREEFREGLLVSIVLFGARVVRCLAERGAERPHERRSRHAYDRQHARGPGLRYQASHDSRKTERPGSLDSMEEAGFLPLPARMAASNALP